MIQQSTKEYAFMETVTEKTHVPQILYAAPFTIAMDGSSHNNVYTDTLVKEDVLYTYKRQLVIKRNNVICIYITGPRNYQLLSDVSET